MFNSARGSVKLEHGSASSSNYESFGLVRQSDSLKRKPEEPLKESDRSGVSSSWRRRPLSERERCANHGGGLAEQAEEGQEGQKGEEGEEVEAQAQGECLCHWSRSFQRKRHSSTSSDSSVEVLDTKNVTPSVELNVSVAVSSRICV